jgi:hypothetical protein
MRVPRCLAALGGPTHLPAVLAVGGALLIGCDATPTESVQTPTAPTFNFVNGPSELPNVVRFSTDAGGFFIPDENSGLIVVEGLPDNPQTLYLCEGGTNPASTLDWQTVGWLRGVVHALQTGEDVNIHVYRLSDVDFSFPGDPFLHLWCAGTPLAAGAGRAKYVDNDFFAVGGKNNAVTVQIHGTVTDLQTEEVLRVRALLHVVQNLAGYPDVPPTTKQFKTQVQLDPIGAHGP